MVALRCCLVLALANIVCSWKAGFKAPGTGAALNKLKRQALCSLFGSMLVLAHHPSVFDEVQTFGVQAAYASEGETKSYADSVGKWSLEVPMDWAESIGDLSGERTVTAFVSPKRKTTSASVVVSPIPADFTRLTSFGDLRTYLIPKGEGIETTVLKEATKGETLTLEYVSKQADENIERHIVTVFALRPAESVVGLTGQALEGDWTEDKAQLEAAVKSFKSQ